VQTKEQSDGLLTQYIIENPQLLVFFDETSSNTNQKMDPYRGNEKRIIGCDGGGFGLAGSVNNNHFSVLCFQSGTGEPIMCAIIFKSAKECSEIPEYWITGIDIRNLQNKNILPEDLNADVAKLYIDCERTEDGAIGGGPVCCFGDKEIKCYCACSPNASITSTILSDMLRYIDSHQVFD
jgi:hypothetical protein